MSVAVVQRPAAIEPSLTVTPAPSTPKYAPRPVPSSWAATALSRERALVMLASPPFVLDRRDAQYRRVAGVRLLLDWLAAQPGTSWQERWLASGADADAVNWRLVPAAWLCQQGKDSLWRREALAGALPVIVAADLIRPTLGWLVGGGGARGGLLARNLQVCRDPRGFADLAKHCVADPRVSRVIAGQIRYLAAQILAAKGGGLAQITVGDVLELFDAEDEIQLNTQGSRRVFYRVLRELAILDASAPPTLRACAPAPRPHRSS